MRRVLKRKTRIACCRESVGDWTSWYDSSGRKIAGAQVGLVRLGAIAGALATVAGAVMAR